MIRVKMSRQRDDLESLWTNVKYAFPILQEPFFPADSDCSREEFHAILTDLTDLKFDTQIRDLVFYSLERHCHQSVAPKFWMHFAPAENEMDGFASFKTAVKDLYSGLTAFANMFERLQILCDACASKRSLNGEKNVIDYMKLLVRASLLSQLPHQFETNVNHFYRMTFNVFLYPENDSMHSDDLTHCAGCGLETEMECQCQQIIQLFHSTNKMLIELNLLERLAGQVLTNLIQERIQDHIYKSYKRSFDVSHVKDLEIWLETTVMTWLTRIYCEGNTEPPSEDVQKRNAINRFKQKLTYFLYETYTMFLIDQLFTIIIDFPDSMPALDDIKQCLDKTELRATLSEKLQDAYETRLLHPGVNTADILTAYIAAIRALKYLDPSGVLLETVTHPVKNYLRTREDTVRSVVSSLTEDGASDLSEELAKVGTDSNPEENEGEIDSAWEEWNPDPIEADPDISSKTRRSNDIISILVNVYGSKELFVNEYRTLLADRLLTQGSFNDEKEIRYLELLKLRFGESQLHFCEVMLKDVLDSKRINGQIQRNPIYEGVCKKFPSSAMILSAQFWPPFKDESLELPDEIKEQLELYTKGFEALKGNRTLNWKPHLGNVNIEIEVADKKLDLSVTPMQATIIIHFQDKPEWQLEELSHVMKVPTTVLRKKIAYWQSMGLLAECSPDTFTLLENSTEDRKHRANVEQAQEMICEDEEESESIMTSAQDQRDGELQVFWSYIVGMLTNLDALPLERIHQMLKMFAAQASGTECSLQELRSFLDTKLRNHDLVLQGGMYRLPKS